MRTARKSSPVTEFVPNGYASWHEYYIAKQQRRQAVRETLNHFAAALASVLAYGLMLAAIQ